MAFDLKLPELGEGVTEGELIKWLVKPGDTVKADQSVAEIMTDKATVEVPTTKPGVVKELKFKAGEVIKVESTILTLDETGAPAKAAPAPAASANKPATAPATNGHAFNPPTSSTGGGGMYELKLPELGEGVTEGELIKWLVKPGDTVKPDQSIAEIMTDKATVEVPTTKGGTVKELKFKAGEVVKVESVLLTLTTDGSGAKAASPSAPAPQAPKTSTPQPERTIAASAEGMSASTSFYPPVMDSKVLATPSTRRLARELQLDINSVSGTGLAGRVTRDDILKRLDNASMGSGMSMKNTGPATSNGMGNISFPKPSYSSNMANAEERVPLKGIRKKIAENLQMAKHIIPHFTLMDEVDVTELVAFRESMKEAAEKAGTKITYLPLVMKALVATIREFPQFNASIDDNAQEIVYKKYFNLGFAADTPNGLVVPVIKGADQKSVLEISKEILELSQKARDNKLKLEEMKNATITITNIGSVGGTYATPIINHPEVAILGMYKIQDRLELAKDGKVISRKYMNFTITADHRLIDGAVAARFLKAFLGRMQKPSLLMLDMH